MHLDIGVSDLPTSCHDNPSKFSCLLGQVHQSSQLFHLLSCYVRRLPLALVWQGLHEFSIELLPVLGLHPLSVPDIDHREAAVDREREDVDPLAREGAVDRFPVARCGG